MELRHLRYFVAVADTGSLGAASARLYMARQPLSVQIQDMERELGVPLFVRHRSGMRLTRAGVEFLDYARAALGEHERALARVRGLVAGTPPLRVGLLELPPFDTVTRLAAHRYHTRQLPGEVVLRPTPASAHVRDVARGVIDVSLHLGDASDLDQLGGGLRTALDVELLLELPITGVLVAAAHPLARREAIDPASLGSLAQIALPRAQHPVAFEEKGRRLAEHGWRAQRPTLELEDGRDVGALLAAGEAWAGVSRLFAEPRLPGVVYRPLAAGAGSPWSLYAVARAGEAHPIDGRAPVVAFLDELRAALRTLEPA